MRIVVTGGGSGGHVSPAIAVIGKLKEKKPEVKLLYIGGKLSMEGVRQPSIEQKVLPTTDVSHVFIHAGKLQRRLSLSTMFLLLGIIPGFFESLYYLWKFKPDVLFSTGGYVAVPVVFAAWLLRTPIVIHEQTAAVGLANKISSFFAKKVAVSFLSSACEFPENKVIVTGNPIRSEVLKSAEYRQEQLSGLEVKELPTIYITTGSQGSLAINRVVKEALSELLKRAKIIHQCGENERYEYFEELMNEVEKLPAELEQRYKIIEYVDTKHISSVYGKADLVVARAGANTVCEIAVLGIPAVFIPIPWVTNNEQYKNARILVNSGSATIIPEDELTVEKLLVEIDGMLANLDHFKNRAREAVQLVPLDAADRLAEEILNLGSRKAKHEKLEKSSRWLANTPS